MIQDSVSAQRNLNTTLHESRIQYLAGIKSIFVKLTSERVLKTFILNEKTLIVIESTITDQDIKLHDVCLTSQFSGS